MKLRQNLTILLLSIAPLSACYETIEAANQNNSISRIRNTSQNNSYDESGLRELPEQSHPIEEAAWNNPWQYVNKCERDNLIRTDNNHLCERVTYHFNAQASAVLVRNHDINGVVDPCSEIIAFPPTGISGIINGDSQNCYLTFHGLPIEECYCNEEACSQSLEDPEFLQCGRRVE